METVNRNLTSRKMSLLNDSDKKIAGANHLRKKNYFGPKLWLLRLKFPSISEVVMSEISLQTRARLTSLSCFLPNVCIIWLSAKPPVMLGRNNGILARNCSGESWQSKSFAHGLVYILQKTIYLCVLGEKCNINSCLWKNHAQATIWKHFALFTFCWQ